MKKGKILVVEDEGPIRKILSETLAFEGYEVVEAVDGVDGLKKALSEKPDLILLDLLLPNMDGMAMLKKVREDSWGEKVPVIILSNANEATRVVEAMENQAFDYLVKSDWQLKDVVRKVEEKIKAGRKGK